MDWRLLVEGLCLHLELESLGRQTWMLARHHHHHHYQEAQRLVVHRLERRSW